MKFFLTAFLLISGLLVTGGANAAANIYVYESGGSVVLSLTGSINTAALTIVGNDPGRFYKLWPAQQYASIGRLPSGTDSVVRWNGLTGGGAWGGGSISGDATAASGDQFFIGPTFVDLPTTYVSGSQLSSTATYAGTLSSLGFINGTYTYTFAVGATADTLNVIVGTSPPSPASIPSLSEWTQLMLALLTITLIGWHFHRERSY